MCISACLESIMVRDIPKEPEQPEELTVLQKVQISAALCLSLGERVDWTIQIAPWHKMGGNGVSGAPSAQCTPRAAGAGAAGGARTARGQSQGG